MPLGPTYTLAWSVRDMAKILFKDGKIQFDDTGKILFTQAGDDPADCACCGDVEPCTDCDPGGSGSSPGSATITNVSQDSSAGNCSDETCSDYNTAVPYSSFDDTTSPDWCQWKWIKTVGSLDVEVWLRYAKVDGVGFGPICGTITLDTGEYGILLVVPDEQDSTSFTAWESKTTGFSCSAATGKISGTHTFGSPCAQEFGCCGGTPTVTVDP